MSKYIPSVAIERERIRQFRLMIEKQKKTNEEVIKKKKLEELLGEKK